MQTSLPLFYYRPTVCWIDDDVNFLSTVELGYAKHYNCITFADPSTAVDFLSSYQTPLARSHFTKGIFESDIYDTNNHLPIDFDISAITRLADLPSKSNEIAVIIVDYSMPAINGLEVFSQLKQLPCKKILLTGEPSQEKIINAFNEGLIDKFLQKNTDAPEVLQQALNELTYQYFQEKTRHLVEHIQATRQSPLSDPVFVKVFNNWCQKNHICEFYLLNRLGSFVAKNKEGKKFYFVVMSEYEKKQFLLLYEDVRDQIDELMNQVSCGSIIPFFDIADEPWKVDFSNWKNNFYSAQLIEGREKYYWAVIAAS